MIYIYKDPRIKGSYYFRHQKLSLGSPCYIMIRGREQFTKPQARNPAKLDFKSHPQPFNAWSKKKDVGAPLVLLTLTLFLSSACRSQMGKAVQWYKK